jgi:hypothetical protein
MVMKMYDDELMTDDFYEAYEDVLESDGITSEEAGFMKGFLAETEE